MIDAHYFYPDGIAAARLGRDLRLPLVITGRGSDLPQIAQEPGPRAQIRWAAREASATVTVCEDLRRWLIEVGAPPERTVVLRNGVDLNHFRPGNREAFRASLDLKGYVILSVGALIPRKGHALTIKALTEVPDATLLIAGSGPLRASLGRLVRRFGLAERVRFLGEVVHRDLPRLFGAADVSVALR